MINKKCCNVLKKKKTDPPIKVRIKKLTTNLDIKNSCPQIIKRTTEEKKDPTFLSGQFLV